MQCLLPGPFVVMQGMSGDGIMNSTDTMPIVDYLDDSNNVIDTDREDNDGTNFKASFEDEDRSLHEIRNLLDISMSDAISSRSDEDLLVHERNTAIPSEKATTDFDKSRNVTRTKSSIQDRVECAIESSNAHNNLLSQTPNRPMSNKSSLHKGYDLDQSPYNSLTRTEIEAIAHWRKEFTEREKSIDQEIFIPCNPQTASVGVGDSTSRHSWWASNVGRLLVFDSLPTLNDQKLNLGAVVYDLPPGATIYGEELVFMDSTHFNIINRIHDLSHSWDVSSATLKGLCIFLRITSPCEGFILFNLEGYYFVGFGEPADYTSPHCWIWRVSYAEGAFVRQGLELDSAHVVTIPFGGLVRVTRKTLNGMGLSRLGIESMKGQLSELQNDTNRIFTPQLGWVSEFLNPLSGRRGPILQPVSFPVPALYRVRLSQGAIIRAGIELSSQEIGHAPYGSILSIVGRSFSGRSTFFPIFLLETFNFRF